MLTVIAPACRASSEDVPREHAAFGSRLRRAVAPEVLLDGEKRCGPDSAGTRFSAVGGPPPAKGRDALERVVARQRTPRASTNVQRAGVSKPDGAAHGCGNMASVVATRGCGVFAGPVLVEHSSSVPGSAPATPVQNRWCREVRLQGALFAAAADGARSLGHDRFRPWSDPAATPASHPRSSGLRSRGSVTLLGHSGARTGALLAAHELLHQRSSASRCSSARAPFGIRCQSKARACSSRST